MSCQVCPLLITYQTFGTSEAETRSKPKKQSILSGKHVGLTL